MAIDLFGQITNAIIDLQAADYHSYDRPLKKLAQLLRHSDLAEANRLLIDGLDLDAFLDNQKLGGSMVGSVKLEWPEDTTKALGLSLLLILRFADEPKFMENFGFTYFYSDNHIMSGINAITRQLIIPFARDYHDFVITSGDNTPKLFTPGSNKVFIVHGHDEGTREGVARFLEKLKLEAIILKEQPNQGRTIIEKFEDYAKSVGFAIILMTPDDFVSSAPENKENSRARQNVIFELGYFAGRLGRGRVCLLRKGEVEIPSDLFGVIYTEMDVGEGWKAKLITELKAANLDVDANKMLTI